MRGTVVANNNWQCHMGNSSALWIEGASGGSALTNCLFAGNYGFYSDSTTGKGTPILIAKGADGSFAAAYTIFKSHEIELDIFPGEEQEAVTDEDIARIVAFLTDIEFAPVEK
jgi:hypothetical protein